MPFELTIGRRMALAEVTRDSVFTPPSDRKVLAAQFREQTDVMVQNKFCDAFADVERAARSAGFVIVERPDVCAEYDKDIEIFLMMPDSPNIPEDQRGDTTPHMVGLFPSKSYTFGREGGKNLEWFMRVRPSVTACALEREDGKAKLWWTFEGIVNYAKLLRRPTEAEAAEFVYQTSMFADKALKGLAASYHEGLKRVANCGVELRNERIQISMADNNGVPFGELLNAMHWKGADFKMAKKGEFGKEAKQGAKEVGKFLKSVHPDGKPLEEPKLEVNRELSGKAAVVSVYRDETQKGEEITLAGFASSSDSIGDEPSTLATINLIENEPESLRAVSAARPLSAMLANHQALAMDKKLG